MSADPPAAATPYDFRRPGRLPDDVHQRLGVWQQSLCTLAAERWAQHMKSAVQWSATSVDTARAAEALAQLPDPGIGCRLTLGETESPTLMVFSRPLMLALVGGMLGQETTDLPADRALTTVEQSLVDLLMLELVQALNDAQPGLQSCGCRVGGLELRPQRVRWFPAEEDVVVAGFEISGPFAAQPAWWVLSEEAIDQFMLGQSQSQREKNPDEQSQVENLIREVPVGVVVRLGGATLHVKELAGLSTGDVVILDQRVSEPLVVTVEGETTFRGWPGRVGSRQAIQITSFVEG